MAPGYLCPLHLGCILVESWLLLLGCIFVVSFFCVSWSHLGCVLVSGSMFGFTASAVPSLCTTRLGSSFA
jgi:hypothetical protein